MITQLHIENYVLIDSLDIKFEEGLNIITGQTGAGKSILLGAIGLLLGAKADGAIVKGGAQCVIEAEFEFEDNYLKPLFEEFDVDYQSATTFRRVVSSAGKSRSFINDIPVPLTTLKAIGGALIDIHSQHQTLLLGNNHFQMEVVDCVAGSEPILEEYQKLYATVKEHRAALELLEQEAQSSRRDEEYLRFQYSQLQDARLVPMEKEELEAREAMLSNATQIKEALWGSNLLLSGSDESQPAAALASIKGVINNLEHISNHSTEVAALLERVESAYYELQDIDTELGAISEGIDADPRSLEKLQSRLDLIYSLEQKHHLEGTDALIALRDSLAHKLSLIENSDEQISEAKTLLKKSSDAAFALAKKLSTNRSKALKPIEKHIVDLLEQLGMAGSRITIELTPAGDLMLDGTDTIRFLFSANKGMPLEKIDKVASGGEMSRLMLALKSLMAEHKSLPTIVFDEIDTGVSGSVADKMGEIMERLGMQKQIINITHLPQVASKGSHHYYVYKYDTADGAATMISKLSFEERVDQIASMLSASSVTEAAKAQARELLGGEKLKKEKK